jgi:pimeloyl-ACP methyl ester carboxylesterase
MLNLLPLLIAVQAAAPAPGRLALAPCGSAMPGAQCGTLEVFENRATRAGRKIGLKVVVLPASGPDRAPDPIFFFAGGPGDSATSAAPWIGRELGGLHRDIVLVDQRGTGGSHSLDCELFAVDDLQSYLGDFLPPEAVKRCRAALEKDADITQYTSSIAMDDIDDVRAALGYEKVNLWGVSYGTRAALVYLRQHGDRVRTVTLQGVMPPTEPMPLHLARDAQRALDGVLADCAADTGCAAAFPNAKAEAAAVFASLDKGPARTQVLDPRNGEARTVLISRDLVAEAIRYLTYEVGPASLVPALLHQAHQGDFAPIAEFALLARQRIVTGSGMGLYLSITCAEDLPRIEESQAMAEARGTFLREYRYLQQRRACTLWPQAKVPAGSAEPVRSEAPVLLLSGQWDPATPSYHAAEAARTLPASLHVVVPHGAHAFDGLQGIECVQRLFTDFIVRGSAKGLDTSCVAGVKRPPMPTALPPLKPVDLPEAEVAKLAGKWVADGAPFEATLRNRGSKLEIGLPGDRTFLMVPVAANRFRVVGALGMYAVFETEGGKPRRMVLEEGGSPTLALKPADQ